MNRFFVPAILIATISGLALTLIVGIVIRSPYTHGNLSSTAGYTRTKVTYQGQTYLWQGMPLAKPAQAQTGDPVHDGQMLFFQYGCASCHLSTGSGGAVGKEIAGDSTNKITNKVREGPSGMPMFTTDMLPDSDLQKIIAFLQSPAASASAGAGTTPEATAPTATSTSLPVQGGPGGQLFATNCSICHGANAAGGYRLGSVVSPDVRWAKLGGDYNSNVSLVTGAILNGTDQAGKDLDPVMPRWKGSLTDQQVSDIITYLQTLTTDAPANQPLAAPAGSSRGAQLFYQDCSLCHGSDGSGGKAVGPATSADLRWTKLKGTYNGDVSLIIRAILQGKDQDGKDLDPAMPRWSDALTQDQVQQIVAFLQTLQ